MKEKKRGKGRYWITNVDLENSEVPEGEEREQGEEGLFDHITAKNLPNLGK